MLKLNKELNVKLSVFKNDKRAYYSFFILAFLFLTTLPTELICNVRPLVIVVEGKPFSPIFLTYSEKDFGGVLLSEPDYKSARFLRILNRVPETLQIEAKNSFGIEMSDFEDETADLAFNIGLNDSEDSEESIDSIAGKITPLLSLETIEYSGHQCVTTMYIFQPNQKPAMLYWPPPTALRHAMVKGLLQVHGKMGTTSAPMTGAGTCWRVCFMASAFPWSLGLRLQSPAL